ncbi:helix-turn-helix domain-containing protein [Methylorubrum sp. B1-46]|uniref:helix-turn-helix transcriptional regulator n=1 Tax=Methylorubrum TaxID=2282523 RepID=UPI001E4ADB07|nr:MULTISPECIES: helix-turn-helix transcriptional regulator [Methylorubrum]MCG5246862.1 helix-turn-helix domain-containing protein [Methylorubrum extorquens]UGB24776.1 helix-turn-helix domain-containing protein [Methylorubrum sp. B1-46]
MYPSGPQIRAARALLNLSRDQLADLAGVSARTIDNLESETRKPIRATQNAVLGALLGAGVEFDPGDPEAGRGPGVYLRTR